MKMNKKRKLIIGIQNDKPIFNKQIKHLFKSKNHEYNKHDVYIYV